MGNYESKLDQRHFMILRPRGTIRFMLFLNKGFIGLGFVGSLRKVVKICRNIGLRRGKVIRFSIYQG